MLRDLGNGLVLRRITAADTDRLCAFNADVLRGQDAAEPSVAMGAWTRDLMEGRNPAFRPGDGTLVEDTRTGTIVSSMLLLSQRWTYGGVGVAVGQPELVGTNPEYRGRGLVRGQFDVIHRWSEDRGDLAQAIAGVPWFYRQFGYELGLAMGGARLLFPEAIGPLDAERAAAWRIRPARDADLDFIAETYRGSVHRYAIATPVDAPAWRYLVTGRSPDSAQRTDFAVIEALDGRPTGFLGHRAQFWGRALPVLFYELAPGVSWRAVWISVLAHLGAAGRALAARTGKDAFGAIGFWLGTQHPVYEIFPFPQTYRPYAWYVRVPDLARFVRTVAPALEARLAASPLVGHSGELRLSFYGDGLRLVFGEGRLAAVERWTPPLTVVGLEQRAWTEAPRGGAMFPGLTFLQLLFGFRSLEELEHAFPDVVVRTPEARALLNALFPRSHVDAWTVV